MNRREIDAVERDALDDELAAERRRPTSAP